MESCHFITGGVPEFRPQGVEHGVGAGDLEHEIDTVGGLVTAVFGRIPRAGEKRTYRGFEVEVLAAERRRVNRVRFRRETVTSPA